MSSWTCLTCGTHNDDVLDERYPYGMSKEITKWLEKEQKRRWKYEEKGEIPPMYCSRCRAKRA